MNQRVGRVRLEPRSALRRMRQGFESNHNWRFAFDILKLIREYRGYSIAILIVTVMQEIIALWPVTLLGQFVDRLQGGELGNVVWLFLGASILAPGIARGNIILRHKMFYETDFQKRVEMTLDIRARGDCHDAETAGKANSLVANAVSGLTNATYYVLGSFTPVLIKIGVVSISLLTYNKMLGLVYLASLLIPAWMTITFNSKMRVLRDTQYSVISQTEGLVMRTITERDNEHHKDRFLKTMRERANVLFSLLSRSQLFLYIRQVALIGSQFLVVFLALSLRARIGMTPGDFTRIIGYTSQVAVAFIEAVACLDAVISYSRAYHVLAEASGS